MHRTEWMRCKVVLTSCDHSTFADIASRLDPDEKCRFQFRRVLLHGLLKLLDQRILDDQWLNILIEWKVLNLNSVAAASHVELLVDGFHVLRGSIC